MHSTTLSEKTQREINNVPSPHVCLVLCPAEAWLLIQLRNSDLSALLVLCKDIIQALLRFLNLSLLCFTDAHLRLDNSQYRTAVCRAFCEVRKWIWNVTNHCFSHYMHLQRAKSNLHSAAVVCFNSQLMKADCCLQQKPCPWNVPWASLPCTALCNTNSCLGAGLLLKSRAIKTAMSLSRFRLFWKKSKWTVLQLDKSVWTQLCSQRFEHFS